jgi:ribosomal protein L7Ae-like RNA K-turn-binding protein
MATTALVASSRGDAKPEQALLGLLGLAARAGQLVSGTEQVRAATRAGRIRLAVLAADAAPAQRDKLVPLLEARGVRYFVAMSRERLGAAIGRTPVSAVGLKQDGFARRATELLARAAGRRDHVQEEV